MIDRLILTNAFILILLYRHVARCHLGTTIIGLVALLRTPNGLGCARYSWNMMATAALAKPLYAGIAMRCTLITPGVVVDCREARPFVWFILLWICERIFYTLRGCACQHIIAMHSTA